jgi:electron transfer flavoprotein beta subunit
VITISPDFTPPIPGVKQILGAKKKPAAGMTLADTGLSEADLAPQFTTESVLAPVVSRKALRMNPDDVSVEDAAVNLVKQLAADGVL